MLRRFLACSSPAIAKLWPSRNSIVVRASRLVSDGIMKPEIWTALREVELAHRRRQAQIDDAASQDRRHERQLLRRRACIRMVMIGAPPALPGCATAPEIRRPPGRRRCHRRVQPSPARPGVG